jgi:hypothetical protein
MAGISTIVDTGVWGQAGLYTQPVNTYHTRLEPNPMPWRDCTTYQGLTEENLANAIIQVGILGQAARSQLYRSMASDQTGGCPKPPLHLGQGR